MKEIILIIFIALVIIITDINSYKNIPFCERYPGHGISYADKKICLMQDLVNNTKNK